VFVEMQGMSKEQLDEYYKAIIPEKPTETTQDDLKKALDELKDDLGTRTDTEDEIQESNAGDSKDDTDGIFGDDPIVRREQCDISEDRPVTQDDLLVERDNVNTNMDEYVPFTEVNEASNEYVQHEES